MQLKSILKNKNFQRWAERTMSLPVLALGLTLLIIYLISLSFLSQVKLQKSSLDELVYKTDSFAKSLSFYYNERLKDVTRLADQTEIRTYFDNLALGMTPEYGLSASVINIETKLNLFVDENTLPLEGEKKNGSIYAQAFFLLEDGRVLARSKSDVPDMRRFSQTVLKDILALPKSDEPSVLVFPVSTEFEMREFAAMPFKYKGSFKGWIVGEIHVGTFFDRFMKGSDYLLSLNGQPIALPLCDICKVGKIDAKWFSAIFNTPNLSGHYQEFVSPAKLQFLAVESKIEHTQFQVVKLTLRDTVLGSISPWILLLGMIGFLVLISVGGVTNYRTRLRQVAAELKVVQKDKNLISAVQSYLLPSESHFKEPYVEIAGYYRAAEEASGDWWWYSHSADRKSLTVAMGDVTGHGPASALLTASVAASFRLLEKTNGAQDLESLLRELNKGFLEFGREQYNMTFVAATFNLSAMTLSYWNAGAPPIFRVSQKTGKPESIFSPGTSLGTRDLVLGHKEIKLELGDRFLFFTDGLSELELPEGKQLRRVNLMKIFTQTLPLDVEAGIEFIRAAADEARADVPLKDDVTYAIIDVSAPALLAS